MFEYLAGKLKSPSQNIIESKKKEWQCDESEGTD